MANIGSGFEQVDLSGELIDPCVCEDVCTCDMQDGDDEGYWLSHASDAEADADVFASIGWGTDEDYGCYEDPYDCW